MRFHRHIYADVSSDYIEPRKRVQSEDVMGHEAMTVLTKLLAGYTVIHQRCECGKYRTQEVIGRLEL